MNFGENQKDQEFLKIKNQRQTIIKNGVKNIRDHLVVNSFSYITKNNYLVYKNRILILNMFTFFESYLIRSLRSYLRLTSNPSNVDREVEQFLRGTFTNVMKKLTKRGINHRLSNAQINELDKFKAVRNLLAHYNGKITQRFINHLNDNSLVIGNDYQISSKYLKDLESLLTKVNNNYDKFMVDQFNILDPDLVHNYLLS